jgi:hypothetical protein
MAIVERGTGVGAQPVWVRGPFRMVEEDIAAVNHVFSEAFTERYRRDGLVGVRVQR